ncbi:hypothetical protein Hanom_Chr16g01485401 [Helianthus anomalus]
MTHVLVFFFCYRMRLFSLINSPPNVVEVVREWNAEQNTPRKDKSYCEASGSKSKDKSSEASRSKSRIPLKRSSDGPSKSNSKIIEDSHVEREEEKEETQCGHCREVYKKNAFWIACDICW